MSRSNYSEDYDEQFSNALDFYRSSVNNAINGKRGQKFLREMIDALDALPEKRLIMDDLAKDGAVCAIGSVGLRRGIDMSKLDPEDAVGISEVFGIAECMAREVVFENDEGLGYYNSESETPEARWRRMREWAEKHMKIPLDKEIFRP